MSYGYQRVIALSVSLLLAESGSFSKSKLIYFEFELKLGTIPAMLSSIKRKIFGTPSTPKPIPVVTAIASPISPLARETNGRHVRKVVDTNTVYNQFEQLKRFQHINSPSDVFYQDKQDRSYITPEKRHKVSSTKANFPVMLVFVAVVSALTASVVVLLYIHLYVSAGGDVHNVGTGNSPYPTSELTLYQRPHQVQQYLPQPRDTEYNSPPSASLYKVIRIRENDALSGTHEEQQIGSTINAGRRKSKYSTFLSLKKLWTVVTSIAMVPVELKDENDFGSYL